MSATLEEKKGILDFIPNFADIAKKQKWVSHYDNDSDSLAIRTPNLSEDSHKKYFNDEFAFYVSKENKVEGVFIEYFVSNFVSHHKDFRVAFKDMNNEIKASKKEDKSIFEFKQNEVRKIVPELESIIINSLIPNNKPTECVV